MLQGHSFNKIYMIVLNNSNSMSLFKTVSALASFKTTSKEAPQNYILTIKDIDEKLYTLPFDTSSMLTLAQQIKNTLVHLNCSLDYFQRYGIRFMSLINCILQRYGVEPYNLGKLLKWMSFCDNTWKSILLRTLMLINNYPSIHTIFVYKNNRNMYLWSMLRANNTVLCKILTKLRDKNRVGAKALAYLRKQHVFDYYSTVYEKMIHILEQKEDQTYLKILLINQFIKYMLLFAHLSPDNRKTIFNNFFVLIQYSCRILKKENTASISKHVRQNLKVIKQGLKCYIQTLQADSLNNVKIQQIKHIISIINGAPLKVTTVQHINQNVFVMRLILRILNSWKKVHYQALKLKNIIISRSNQEMNLNQFAKKEKENQLMIKMQKGKIDQIKEEFTKLSKSRSNLCKRKSLSLKSDSFLKTNLPSMQNRIKITKEIQSHVSRCASKLDGLKLGRTMSFKDQKRSTTLRKGQQKEMKMEDYAGHMQKRLKIVPNTNKIQLYRPNMAPFCKKEGKNRLHLSIVA